MQKDGGGSGEEILLKALGLKKMVSDNNKGGPLVIYDLTAGLARDSLIILNSFVGNNDTNEEQPIRLHMVERDKIVASLVLDAMRRLQLLAELDGANSYTRQLVQCLSMEQGDAVQVLKSLSSNINTSTEQSVPFPPHICYLDPMFPPRKKKSSAVKKDMSMLHSLLGTAEIMQDDKSQSENIRIEQEQRLLEMACRCAIRRVVVKRPIAAPPLGHLSSDVVENSVRSPSYDIRGSVNRWDVYVIS
jgi:16S rRNA (guanine1516-N2)-methyltransferase